MSIDALTAAILAGFDFALTRVSEFGPGAPCPSGVVAPSRFERTVTTYTFTARYGYLSVRIEPALHYGDEDPTAGTFSITRLPPSSDGRNAAREMLERMLSEAAA